MLLPYRLDGSNILFAEMREEDIERYEELCKYIDIVGGLPHRFTVNDFYRELAYVDPLVLIKKNGKRLSGWKRIKKYHDRQL